MRALIPLAILLFVGFVAWTSESGCGSNPGEPFDASGTILPKTCKPGDAVTLPVGECSGCTELAYALCVGSSYSACSCTIPSGYTVVVDTQDGS
jgi:hypothetical protein